MRNKILLVVGVAFVAYVLGSRSATVQINKGESVRHQLVRMWNDPKARKQRHKAAEKAAKKARKALRG
ncbi:MULTISPECIES: hypothetical protein [Microbacterium]|jgi:hypothetical protein|uniref:Uncharacterized protein n=2 Tax=Microbacterium maritypicum TaxID=33918 RepID=A0A4Y4B6N6_MICMQ|nr:MULTISPECIES: hypothetical protein [Microbacterium]EYT60476.1 hypothetical protein D514_0105715 [Microbacterium sp. UCD-TDU]KAB1886003.1 hypothetical protein F6W70_00620 [Microbacterium liquefaciens]KQV02587.1 hypothetical protein ASC55_09995 [Microbacterium sp. Root322]MBP5803937.1 hypothetical protein [Microbacterium liquefaciens]QYG12531.1 hypothetical protein KY497_04455 [Microbacterium sp. PAMC22086]